MTDNQPKSYWQDSEGRTFYLDSFGNKIEVRDQNEHQRQIQDDSHLRFFKDNPKHKMKRSEAVQKRFEQMVHDRADVNYHPDVKQVTDNEFIHHLRYDPMFVPLGNYQHKLVTSSGKVVRPILAGEVGMKGSTIYVLEQGYGRASQVPDKLE